jgi:dephospho-CoA kinase
LGGLETPRFDAAFIFYPFFFIIIPMIIGIAGPTASGKTTVAVMLAEKTNAFRIKYSDILSTIAFERGLDPEDKSTLQNLFLSERETKGEDFLTKALEEKVNSVSYPNIIIEGNRRLVDIDTLRRIAKNKNDRLLLLYIDATVDTRFQRYNHRMEKHGEPMISFEDFLKLENNGAEDELDELKAIFAKEGLLINANTSTPQEVFDEVSQYFQV